MRNIAIIGGGPAGIALARNLDSHDLPYTIYESNKIGATWSLVPPDLKVLSPWWVDVLTLKEAFKRNPFSKPPSRYYYQHLLDVASKLKGNISENSTISNVELFDGCWRLKTNDHKSFKHDVVVLATGYFSSPRNPEPMFQHDGSIPIGHASEITDYNTFDSQELDKVLVVGGRVTAGQLVIELIERGIKCDLSIKSEISFDRAQTLVNRIRENLYLLKEELMCLLAKPVQRDSYPGMSGETKPFISSGDVHVYPEVSSVCQGKINFSDGSSERYSKIIFATGYSSSLSFLSRNIYQSAEKTIGQFEVDGFDGLFLLGFDNVYDFRSRYLRGIRSDARRLAKIIRSRIHS